MSEPAKYIVARKEIDGYSTRGPVASPMTIAEAAKAGEDLARQYPDQDFVVLGVVGEVVRINAIVVKPMAEAPSALPPALKAVAP